MLWDSDDNGECYMVGGPLNGRTYAFPQRYETLYFPAFEDEFYPSWNTRAIDPDMVDSLYIQKHQYRHIVQEIYWYAGRI